MYKIANYNIGKHDERLINKYKIGKYQHLTIFKKSCWCFYVNIHSI